MMPHYSLFLAPQNDDVVGFLQDAAGGRVANIQFDKNEAKKIGDDLRIAAAEWAAAYEFRTKKAENKKEEASLWLRLHELGAEFFEFIFHTRAVHVQDVLTSEEDDTRLCVNQLISDLNIPWGFLCNPTDLQHFTLHSKSPMLWGGKYNLTVNSTQCGGSGVCNAGPWSFIPILCRPTYQSGIELLPDAAAPLAMQIRDLGVDPTGNRLKASVVVQNCLLYVHAHANIKTGKLVFEQLHGDKIEVRLSKIVDSLVPPNGIAVLVLNACGTIRAFQTLANALTASDCHAELACIVTEIPVHKRFAMQFGLELIDRCLQRGESTVQAMSVLRKNHYPISVIYTYYCYSDHTISPSMSVLANDEVLAFRSSIENINYSNFVGESAVLVGESAVS